MARHALLHSLITSRLLHALERFVARSGKDLYVARGAGFAITSGAPRIPDLLVISRPRFAATIAAARGWLHLSPDLAVEVATPNDQAAALAATAQQYIERGTNTVWVVNPQRRTVTVYLSVGRETELSDDMVLTETELLPGFGIGIRDIFPDIRAG